MIHVILFGWDGGGSAKECLCYDDYFFYMFWEFYLEDCLSHFDVNYHGERNARIFKGT